MFFHIGNVEFFQLQKPGAALHAAMRLKLSDTFLTVLSIAARVGMLTLIASTCFAVTTILIRSDSIMHQLSVLIGFAIFACIMAGATYALESLANTRKKLLDGEYRKFFVSSNDESFNIVFSAQMRESFERNLNHRRHVRELFESLRWDDGLIGRERPKTISQHTDRTKTRLFIISAAESLHNRLGIDSGNYFKEKRNELYSDLSYVIRSHEQDVDTARTVLASIRG
jgi:hypothetical protein